MRKLGAAALAICVTASAQSAPSPAETLLDRATLTALDDELSGVAAKDHVSRLTQLHRVPASPGFHEAIEYVKARATAIGLSDVQVETFPGDGNTWFGTLHGNRGWRVEGGTLDEVRPQPRRIVSYDDTRLAVADNSESADVTVELVDVGRGTDRRDYDGKDVRGKLVLCDAAPSACHRQAVEEHGAAGLISYNSNQVSAWWRDDQDLIRWGHLDSRGRRNTFALMISVREARSLQQRLASGERITLHAVVKARNDDSMPYETLVATIPGTDLSSGDIVFSCHLDHEKPGANDNASGCSANLEIARALRVLIAAKRIPAPARTIRFVWPSEMTGTIAYLSKYPAIASRIRAAVHLDMVGGDPFVTKSILHDVADNIEPTKLKRSAFIAAASGYYLATMPDHGTSLLRLSYANAYERLAEDGRRAAAIAAAGHGADAANIVAQALLREQRRLRSLSRFVDLDAAIHLGSETVERFSSGLAEAAKGLLSLIPTSRADESRRPVGTDARVPQRNADVKGPLAPNGEWVMEKAGASAATAAIARLPNSGDVTYEIVNFVDGVRSVREIRDAVSAEFEPIDLAAVAEYLDLLAKAGAITFRR